jgi:flagellar biosynthesis component FlhA
MSRSLMLIVAGVLVMLAPFSGLPMAILTWILPVLGAAVVAIGVSYKRERMRLERPAPSHEESVSASA